MARNDGKQFEELLHDIYTILAANDHYTSVERNVQLDGQDGSRQIDVLIRSKVAGIALKTVVECRDHNKRLDVIAVDAFQSKLTDVGANKGVLVSRKGFSGTAIKKAKRVGITLCTASNAADILLSLGLQIPVVITDITAQFSRSEGVLTLKRGTNFDNSTVFNINDKYLPTVFREEVLLGMVKFPLQSCTFEWSPQSILQPFFIRDTSGEAHIIEGFLTTISITVSHFFGHLNDLPEVTAMHDFSDSSTCVFLKSEDIPGFKQRLAQYKDRTQIPCIGPVVSLVTVAIPEILSSLFIAENSETGQVFTIAPK